MKQLVVLCYPLSRNMGQLVWAELSAMYEKYKLDFEVRDLYQIGFNPVNYEYTTAMVNGSVSEDILIEQEHILNADCITFIYSSRLIGMPALLKGYLDLVFSEGFAYLSTDKGVKKLLKGKKVIIVNTFDQISNANTIADYSNHVSMCEKRLFEFCGMEVILHYYIDKLFNTDKNSLKTTIKSMIIEMKKTLVLSKNSHLTIPPAFF